MLFFLLYILLFTDQKKNNVHSFLKQKQQQLREGIIKTSSLIELKGCQAFHLICYGSFFFFWSLFLLTVQVYLTLSFECYSAQLGFSLYIIGVGLQDVERVHLFRPFLLL